MPDLSIIRTILIMLTFSLLLGLLAERKFATKLRSSIREFAFPAGIIALFFGWRILSSLFAPAGANTVFTAVRDMIYFLVPFTAALLCLHGSRDLKIIALLVAISATLSAIVGIVEYGTGFRLYAELTASDSAWNIFDLNKGRGFRGSLGTFPHPLAFGAFLTSALLFTAFLFIGKENQMIKFVGLLSVVMCLLGIIASTSRGAQASLVAAMAWGSSLYMIMKYQRSKRSQRLLHLPMIVMPFLFVVIAGVTSVGYSLVQGDSEKQLSSSMMRVLQLQMSVPLISARPVLGYGVGEAAKVLGLTAETVDIYYLTLALECGLLGFMFFLILIVFFLLKSAKAYLTFRHPYFMVMTMFFAAESTQLLVLSLKQVLPLLYIGFALLLILQREIACLNNNKEVRVRG